MIRAMRLARIDMAYATASKVRASDWLMRHYAAGCILDMDRDEFIPMTRFRIRRKVG
jgi:hypothetical protein